MKIKDKCIICDIVFFIVIAYILGYPFAYITNFLFNTNITTFNLAVVFGGLIIAIYFGYKYRDKIIQVINERMKS